jgi:hypothetical protein
VTPIDRRTARRAEIERDHRLVTAALVGALRRILHRATTTDTDPEHLWQHVQDALETSRENFRRLNNARINLRAARFAQRFDDSTALPQAMVCYRHRGNYRGEFRSMAALGALLRRSLEVPGVVTRPQETPGFAEDLHLRGELWTFELADSIHVFTTPQTPSDVALARLRPPRTVGCTRNESTSPVL